MRNASEAVDLVWASLDDKLKEVFTDRLNQAISNKSLSCTFTKEEYEEISDDYPLSRVVAIFRAKGYKVKIKDTYFTIRWA